MQCLGHWENLGSFDPNASNKSKKVIHRKPFHVFNSTFDTKWDECSPSEGRLIIPVLVYLGIGASQGKNPNKGHGYTEIHP